ncbi:SGNH/GDSL hydrolase family protein [Myxococcota bacterium]|nr:SGNH/GDSL hydrolase family protein [Myxococcota bacterium]
MAKFEEFRRMSGRMIRLLGMWAILLIIGSLLLEVAARYFLPDWAPVANDRNFWDYDPELGWSGVPNAKGRQEYIDFSVDVSINSAGLRDSEYSIERVPGKKRMLLLADSFGWGFGVEQDEIFTERIEARRDDWEIINGSVSGFGTDQEYLYYVNRGHRYRPDVVFLLFHGGNDFTNSAHSVQYWHYKPLFLLTDDGLELSAVPVPEMSWRQRLANYVAGNTYFFRMASGVFVRWLAPTGEGSASAEKETVLRENHGSSRALEVEERIVRLLLALNEAVQENGGRLVVMRSFDERNVFEDPRLKSSGIDFIDLANVFADATEPTTFEHDTHWTPAGHAIVADFVEGQLTEIGVFVSGVDDDRP